MDPIDRALDDLGSLGAQLDANFIDIGDQM
jgi:hypothetical protein